MKNVTQKFIGFLALVFAMSFTVVAQEVLEGTWDVASYQSNGYSIIPSSTQSIDYGFDADLTLELTFNENGVISYLNNGEHNVWGSINYEPTVSGMTYLSILDSDSNLTTINYLFTDNGALIFSSADFDMFLLSTAQSSTEGTGCIEEGSFNYDPNANVDDESCCSIARGCVDPTAENYDPESCFDASIYSPGTGCYYEGEYIDECGIINGDNSSCLDVCGVPNGTSTSCLDQCGVVDGSNDCLDLCGVVNGDNTSCLDLCGVVNGDNSSCLDDCGVPNGDNTSCIDQCGVVNGNNDCLDLCGEPNGDNSSCQYFDFPLGWSMFGFTCFESLDVIESFEDISASIDIVKDELGLAFLPAWGFSAFATLEFGEGYQIKMAEEVTDYQFCDPIVIEDGVTQADLDSLVAGYAGWTPLLDLEIGDFHKGGIVFSIDESGQSGLVAALEDLPGTHDWFEAFSEKDDYVSQGYPNWRLPSMDEMRLLVSVLGAAEFDLTSNYWLPASAGCSIGAIYYSTSLDLFGCDYSESEFKVRYVRAF